VGTLHATGFTHGAPPDLPPTAIDQARWRILDPDFKNSSATSPGLALDGIRIFFSANAPADEPPVKAERRPTACDKMMRVLPEVGSNFKNLNEMHADVLKILGIEGEPITGKLPRGYGYDNFRAAKKRMDALNV